VQSAVNTVSSAVQGDATNARALENAGVKECDVAVVAIGGNVEASLLATANCKELGVPTVISKASSELHGRILKKIGANQVIFPDRESAYRLARSVMDSEAAADDKQTDESDLATKNTEVTKS
jgi:trk system potassium uptake protein TrkA